MIDIGLIGDTARSLDGLSPESRQKIHSVISGLQDFLDAKDTNDPDGIDDLLYEIDDAIDNLGNVADLQDTDDAGVMIRNLIRLLLNARDAVAAS